MDRPHSEHNTIPTRVVTVKATARGKTFGSSNFHNQNLIHNYINNFRSYKNMKITRERERERDGLPYKKEELGRRSEEDHRGIDSRKPEMKTREL